MKQSTKINGLLAGVTVVLLIVGGVLFLKANATKTANESYVTQTNILRKKGQLSKFQVQRPAYSAAELAIDQFMSGYLTFDNQQDFDDRAKAVKSLVTPGVYADKKLFKVDKYHKITQMSLEGTYVKSEVVPVDFKNDQLTATVYATQTLNIANQQGKNTVKVFNVAYDSNTNKITSVEQTGVYTIQADSELM